MDEQQRSLFLRQNYDPFSSLTEIEIKDFIKKTTGLYYGEMQTLFDLLNYEMAQTRELKFQEIFQKSLKKFSQNRKFQQENKLNIDLVNWNDIGGLMDIKQIIIDTIMFPLNYPKLFASNEKQLGITRSGILLYGPPGKKSHL